jgi:CRP/FNR family cyclic AMP-dependent transcriptional regulator
MISPELLRQYPFFRSLDESQLTQVAMLAEEEIYESGEIIFHEGESAAALYFLLDGYVDLYYTIGEGKGITPEKGIPVGEINPGEPFGISALIEPYLLTATARTNGMSRVIKLDATLLRSILGKDRRMAYLLTHQAAKAAIDRLHATRVQLAAAWA